jgi:hypothetical protein
LCRASDLFLPAIPTGDLSSYHRIPNKTQEKDGDDEQEQYPIEVENEERCSSKKGNHKYQKIRNDLFPSDCALTETFRNSPWKQHATQPAFSKGTGFAIIIAINTMTPHQP